MLQMWQGGRSWFSEWHRVHRFGDHWCDWQQNKLHWLHVSMCGRCQKEQSLVPYGVNLLEVVVVVELSGLEVKVSLCRLLKFRWTPEGQQANSAQPPSTSKKPSQFQNPRRPREAPKAHKKHEKYRHRYMGIFTRFRRMLRMRAAQTDYPY